jgi:hypothetical protein
MEISRYDLAHQKVMGPAIGLIVSGALDVVFGLVCLGMGLFALSVPNTPVPKNVTNPEAYELGRSTGKGGPLCLGMLSMVVGVPIIVGGTSMLQMHSYGFVFASSILAVIPCISSCFLISIPFGIWGLVVLNNPEVRAAFH